MYLCTMYSCTVYLVPRTTYEYICTYVLGTSTRYEVHYRYTSTGTWYYLTRTWYLVRTHTRYIVHTSYLVPRNMLVHTRMYRVLVLYIVHTSYSVHVLCTMYIVPMYEHGTRYIVLDIVPWSDMIVHIRGPSSLTTQVRARARA